ncbi:MAG: IS1595 family transposase [Pseudomonadota bacterium]
MKTLSVQDFFKMFPDDEACLEHLFKTRFGNGQEVACPKCGEIGKFRRLAKLPAYTCNCGHHIHPMVGTPFEDSRTPLQKWFYAMYLFTTSRHGVPAKELQRQLSVTYKCAWRIGHEIRKYMGMVDGNPPLSGTVEADETYVGGKRKGTRGRGASGKTVVFGMLEKDGDVMTHVVPNVQRKTLQPIIEANVEKGSEMQTDELPTYHTLAGQGYSHTTVNHGAGEYVRGLTHVNGLEGFWSQIKRSIKGTHIHVSGKHMSKYLGEFEYRYNLRKTPEIMFDRLLEAF